MVTDKHEELPTALKFERDVYLEEEDRHEHDCTMCHYVGSYLAPLAPDQEPQQIDLYLCEKQSRQTTVIMRYSSDGPNYSSTGFNRLLQMVADSAYTIRRYGEAVRLLAQHGNPEIGEPTFENPINNINL
jgi:hypothetical protein